MNDRVPEWFRGSTATRVTWVRIPPRSPRAGRPSPRGWPACGPLPAGRRGSGVEHADGAVLEQLRPVAAAVVSGERRGPVAGGGVDRGQGLGQGRGQLFVGVAEVVGRVD